MEEKYTLCINQALAWVRANYSAQAVFICGSIVRGTANADSDFDIYVLHNDNYRQRVQKFFNGVPCEIFINSIVHTHTSFETELKNNRPCTAHMLATGLVYFDNKSIDTVALVEEAKRYMQLSLGLTDKQQVAMQYSIAQAFEDAKDVIDTDEATAVMLLNKTITEVITYLYAVNKKPLPGIKHRIANLQDIDKSIADMVYQFYKAATVKQQHKLVSDVLNKLGIPTGFFEWQSDKTYN